MAQKSKPTGQPAKRKKLTPQRKRFAEEYVICLCRTKAARIAFPNAKRHEEIAYQLWRDPDVREYIDALMIEREKRTRITQDAVVQELAKIGFANIGEILDFDGSGVHVKNSKELTSDQTAIIAEISDVIGKYDRGIKVKLYDKVKALEVLLKHTVERDEASEDTNNFLDALQGTVFEAWDDAEMDEPEDEPEDGDDE